MNRLINNIRLFRNCSSDLTFFSKVSLLFKYLVLRVKYGIGLRSFFEEKLYNDAISHDAFYNSQHKYLHTWNVVHSKFRPDIRGAKLFLLKCDYLLSRIIYPGLDAMDYFRYEFYNIRHSKRKTFITEGAMVKMDRIFNGSEEGKEVNRTISNKAEFNRLFSDVVTREWYLSDESSYEDFLHFCEGKDKVIIKPLEEGGGKGIYVASVKTEADIKSLYDDIKQKRYIVEELVVQHTTLHELNKSSVNTVRVYSVCKENEVFITGGTLRIGCGDGPTDNYSRGGLAAEIDIDTGVVISKAVSQNADSVYVHPMSKKVIIGTKIPMWDQIKDSVKKAHLRVSELGYVGWDVVVCSDSSITFLEANTCAGVELQQHPALSGKKPIYEKFIKL